ncbi:hypothetical protein K7I13_03560 [Brucepastera parasyntrophica]|uniref:hypothetical protein n=1 Tax=Brucepastera parasyntrophica TaxID=2880008 RepID=UPI00210E76CA|nr:hypothetical protein [Brucepastera parasyntrophica]ULQ60397.1 hypothetical protein K7I13_03560 [Brucepastera parasyntrophica]
MIYEDDEEYPEYPDVRRFPEQAAANTAGAVIHALSEYMRTLEQEKSKRRDIERKRIAALSVIRTEREAMLLYLRHRFGERRILFEEYFRLVDTALQEQNTQAVSMILETIMEIYRDNPGAGIDEFRGRMSEISEVIRI